ncbi:nicotinate phosphoribosyltransferase [Jatrophihabitans sp. YIM 134969]
MLAAALREGTAEIPCTFEVFGRRLPDGRRYGVVAGTERALDALAAFRFEPAALEWMRAHDIVDETTAAWLADYRFTGDVEGYPEGEVYFPDSPLFTVRGGFGEAVVLETVLLSVLNHDVAVASAAARMAVAAGDRPVIEMGGRRTHEDAAVAAARAAYLAGFASTSNLAAGRRWGVPTGGTAAHAFTLLHATESEAFAAQVASAGPGTTLLVDTYDITQGIANAVEAAGTSLGAIRIDSGDLGPLAVQAREQLDALGATSTRVVVSGDLDEYAIAGLAVAPVDVYGAGTSVVTGSGAPTAGLVYKLVEVDGRPVAKRSTAKATHGGAKTALRTHRASGTATEEILVSGPGRDAAVEELLASEPGTRRLQVPLVRAGERVRAEPIADAPAGVDPALAAARARLREALGTLPWEGLSLSRGEPAIPVRFEVTTA